jgi:precorrin-6B methylase 2
MDHGHHTLIKYIKTLPVDVTKNKTIIEIGSVREFLEGQNSTECFMKLCIERNMKLVSVDMDEKCSENVRVLCKKYDFDDCEIFTMKGEDYLKSIPSFDFIYLDGYDYDHGKHSEERQQRYIKNLGETITNEECWKGHLEMSELLHEVADKNSVICFDDIISESVGKGVTALPFLLKNDWTILDKTSQCMLLVRKNNDILDTEIYVVGNGRSLKGFDFNFLKDKKWIGCCLAYRDWERTGIYPTHYVNVDGVVLKHNVEDIKNLIVNKKCQTFLLSQAIIPFWKEIVDYKNVYFIEQLYHQPYSPFRNLIDYCSGTSAVTYAYIQRPKKIHLLGMDCKYTEFLLECLKQQDGTLKIVKEIKENPNYFIDDYQRVGDVYNQPNANRVHKQSWFDVRNLILTFNIIGRMECMIYNYNDNDELDEFFERKSLSELK